MKEVKGIQQNITEPIVGCITLSGKILFNRKKFILIKKGLSKIPNGYSAVVSDQKDVITKYPFVGDVNEINTFCEGDVVKISPDGSIKFLYESNAVHNAVFVTGRCNHRCIMCPQPPVIKEDDETELNLKIISLFDKKTKSVGITGGEPTMIGDNLFKIIMQIKRYSPNASIDILSNGVLFADENYTLKLAKCNHPDLQIDIPIFSDIPTIHNKIVGANTFYKTVEGLYNLAKYGLKIGIRVVIHKLTYQRLANLADYIYRNFPFVSQVAFLQMETTGLASQNLEDLWIDPFDYNIELEHAVFLLKNRGINPLIYNAQLCVLPRSLHPFAVKSITDWKDGFIKECHGCKLIDACPGVFMTNGTNLSKHIHKMDNIS